jgi:hypothetical protein
MSIPLTFGLAQNVSNEFSSFPMDGIVGLGRPENIANKDGNVDAPALMDVLISEKIISAKLFGIDLWRADDGGTNDGEINFGKPDSSRFSGGLNYLAAIKNTNGFWEIPVKDAGVNGNIAGLQGRTAIIDSGTSYILMPHDDAVQLHELISGYKQDGTEMFIVPCESTAKVQLTFGSITYDISPKDYVGRKTTNGCSSNIIGRQTFGTKQWLVGDVFLKNVYTVFDFDGQRVGFGVKKSAGPAASSSSTGMVPSAEATEIASTSIEVTSATSFPTPSNELISVTVSSSLSTSPPVVITYVFVSPAESYLSTLAAPSEATVTQDTTTSTTAQSTPSAPHEPPQQVSLSTSQEQQQEATTTTSSTLLTTTSSSGTKSPSATAATSSIGPTLLPPGASVSSSGTESESATSSGSSSSSGSASSSASGAEGRASTVTRWTILGLGAVWSVMFVFG